MPKLLVLGGTGFLGKHICFEALKAGFSVTSISRKGIEGLKYQSSINPKLISQIEWKQGNIFEPSTFEEDLKSTDAVVHSVGIAFANENYKTLLKQSSLADLLKFGSCHLAQQFRGPNPMRPNDEFDKMNRQTAVTAAQAYSSTGVGASSPSRRPFVYISAEDWNPMLSPRYIESKRQAEDELSNIPGLRTVFIRPGLMYDKNVTDIRSNLAFAMSKIPLLTKPLAAQTVAKAVVEACKDDTIDGVISWKTLDKFSQASTA